MKAKKKRVGTKAQIRAVKERERRTVTAIFLAFILLIVIFSAYFTYTFLNQSPDQSLIEPTLQFKPENPNPQLKAAIIDHLSLTIPNQHLITERQTMKNAVIETMKEVGPDPAYKSLLIYYPPEAGEQTIEDIKGNPTTKP